LIAARSGNSDAKYRIATFYARGDGVAKNYAAAEDWYYKAALDGNVAARAELAQLWSSGLGVEKKPEKALALYYLLENDVPISVNEKISNLKRELTQKQLVEALEHIAEFSSPTEKLPNKSSNTDGEDAAGS
jgi:hypothetical protein